MTYDWPDVEKVSGEGPQKRTAAASISRSASTSLAAHVAAPASV